MWNQKTISSETTDQLFIILIQLWLSVANRLYRLNSHYSGKFKKLHTNLKLNLQWESIDFPLLDVSIHSLTKGSVGHSQGQNKIM